MWKHSGTVSLLIACIKHIVVQISWNCVIKEKGDYREEVTPPVRSLGGQLVIYTYIIAYVYFMSCRVIKLYFLFRFWWFGHCTIYSSLCHWWKSTNKQYKLFRSSTQNKSPWISGRLSSSKCVINIFNYQYVMFSVERKIYFTWKCQQSYWPNEASNKNYNWRIG